jgi:hypothetical protein
LCNKLRDEGRKINNWVNKFVAHAASLESRRTIPAEECQVSLAMLWNAERCVFRVANFISYDFVDGTNIGGVPVQEDDQFEHLDQAFIAPPARKAMDNAWNEHCKEIQACKQWKWNEPLTDN